MAGLPWVRLDSNFFFHDKVLALKDDPSTRKRDALLLYLSALCWSVQHGTDGKIPTYSLKVLDGKPADARLLVKYQLWDEATSGHPGWTIRNFADRQQLSDETYTVRKQQSAGGKKGNCVRHHGPDCGCWRNG